MKIQVDEIEAIPSKRIFMSIMSDYDLNCSISELIDNALDIWVNNGRKTMIIIDVDIDLNQKNIKVTDNAGGLKKAELAYIVGPGQTGNNENSQTIGIFGVGTKRAVVALAQEVKIITRYKKEKTYQIEFDDDWLGEESWKLPVYQVSDIPEGTTVIELQKLRFKINEDSISILIEHLKAAYAKYLLDKRVKIRLNTEELEPIIFEKWAYPPEFSPRKYVSKVNIVGDGDVEIDVIAGLSLASNPSGSDYGVYFYCNDRLVAKGLKTYEVGFTSGLAGQPHPSISLTRIIVSIKGKAKLMPWNSSKSSINTNHPVFIAIRPWLVQVIKEFASLSRRWQGEWHDKVFKYKSGDIVNVNIENIAETTKSYLPPLPKAKPNFTDIIKQVNRKIASSKPWTKGLYESIIAVDIISKQKLEQKNRLVLIILDSTLEIAFKDFLLNECEQSYSEQRISSLFSNRIDVEKEIKKFARIKDEDWRKINHYYRMRCKLIHERSSVAIGDSDIEEYRMVVEKVLNKLFKLKFQSSE